MNELRKSRSIILALTVHTSAQTDQQIRYDQYSQELHRINYALTNRDKGICYHCLDITDSDYFYSLKCDMCDQYPNLVVMMICGACFHDVYSHVCSECANYQVMRSHNHVVEDGDLCTYCDNLIIPTTIV